MPSGGPRVVCVVEGGVGCGEGREGGGGRLGKLMTLTLTSPTAIQFNNNNGSRS